MAVRRKKKSANWKGFAAGVGLAGIFGLLLMWAAAGPSGLKLREAVRARMSVLADRADQFVEAWNHRQMPGQPGGNGPAPIGREPERPPARQERPVLAPAPAPERPALAPAAVAPPAAAAPTPAPATAAPPPDKDISPDDQKQLRELMQRINQGH